MIKVGILGGSGYGGSELLRILLFHPEVEVKLVTANEHAGKRVDRVHPNLAKLTDLTFAAMPDPRELEELDCVFLALPHGQAMEIAPALRQRLNHRPFGRFSIERCRSVQAILRARAHGMTAQREFVYGLTEVNRKQIKEALADCQSRMLCHCA